MLRKALGDDSEQYIETLPRRGYRFAARPAEAPPLVPPERGPVRGWLIAAAALAGAAALVYWQFYAPSRYLPHGGVATLAVVPFDRIGAVEPEFAEGLVELLAVELAKLDSVQVISPSTIRRYRRLRVPVAFMTRVLGAQVVVEGSAQKMDGRLRVGVRLTDVHSGRVIWAENYDPAGPDSELTREAARAIGAHLRR